MKKSAYREWFHTTERIIGDSAHTLYEKYSSDEASRRVFSSPSERHNHLIAQTFGPNAVQNARLLSRAPKLLQMLERALLMAAGDYDGDLEAEFIRDASALVREVKA